ncbi:GH25 family lysozyme [Clostridium sp. AM58-1XD]|uniref:GH25 family lysozyme n=1 Tax=Clostridium sp. AM58-1XD TaxID=2292307 RepID=UPI000E5299C7|nr:GH25 family lysozyme [Clostridium sp. AM58-1XD]RGZ01851.1 glycoside hydrolase [Clostridium sp. AM58-1XD]
MKYVRRIAACALAGLIGISACAFPATAYAQEWEKVGGSYQMADGTVISRAIARGIDVSHWQQEIDWKRVAADDVSFVMLGTRYKGDVDPRFRNNAEAAHREGIKLGAYIYSYATSVEMAEAEADFILNLIKDYPISYPVAFDAEDAGTLGTLSPSQVSEVINAFCRKIEAAGYHPMVYANEYWLKNKIDLSAIDYDIWVARYNIMHTFGDPSMWQATSTGSIEGINGNVDIDFLYKDFSEVIPADTWRTIGKSTYYYKDYQMQKSAWIDDGDGWYYMNAEGNPSRGWTTFPEGTYYLDENSGKMATGWKQFDGSWYYFKPSGAMATGWRDVDNAWYYLDGEGRMQTGWKEIQGETYYLEPSGTMASGWKELDGSRYYFKPSGAMATGWRDVDNTWYYLDREGRMQTGWQDINGTWYYMNADGKMQTGWQDIGGSRYYLGTSGAMAAGWQEIDGKKYYFRPSGAMVTDWKQIDGSWYYLNSSGELQTGWQDINGTWYYMNADGKMQTGWQDIGGSRYYLSESGAMVTGWQEISGSRYYFSGSGALAVNTVLELDGVKYQAGADGVCKQMEEAGQAGEGQDGSDQTGADQTGSGQTGSTPSQAKGPGEP